jgi:Predicted membrane protein
MNIFAKLGELILKMFDIVGMLILAILKLPSILRGIKTDDIKDKVNSESLKENLSKVKGAGLEIGETGISKVSEIRNAPNLKVDNEEVQAFNTHVSDEFTSKQKERAVFQLQLISIGFLAVSVLYIFKFLSFIIYCVLGIVLVGYILHMLISKLKLMYPLDFNAYRDFFLMYVAAGIILVLVGTNSSLVMAFSFQFFPDLTILVFALILALAVFLIFRIRYHRSYTYGTVIETGKTNAYVKVDYDICSNVKPDVYYVSNECDATEGDEVKLQIEEKLLSNSGNKPVSIIEILK